MRLAEGRHLFFGEWSKYTELVAFGVRQHDPRALRRLSDVHVRRSETNQSLDFGELIARSKVDVHSVLDDAILGDQEKDDVRHDSVRG